MSSYATMHPAEDWAETFAHYLHIRDTVDTAAAFGFAPAGATLDRPLAGEAGFQHLIELWLPLAWSLNMINRSMGHKDLYPFVLPPRVLHKMSFVHRVVEKATQGSYLLGLHHAAVSELRSFADRFCRRHVSGSCGSTRADGASSDYGDRMATIAWVGLGHMGVPMTANLVRAGHEVRGFDLSTAAVNLAAENGVRAMASVGEAAAGADVLITMLQLGAQVRAVLDEAMPVLAPGSLIVDSSTIAIDDAKALHELVEEAGFGFLDAPVSGGVPGATAGTLTFMVGGSAADVERADPSWT